MNEILNQKFGVEVEMYNISRSKAAQIVAATLTELTGVSWNYSLPGDTAWRNGRPSQAAVAAVA